MDSHANAKTISEPWNAWALTAANEKADALKLDADRRAAWLKQVGA